MAALPTQTEKAEELSSRYNPGLVSPFPYQNILKEENSLRIFEDDTMPSEIGGFIAFDNGSNEFVIVVNKNLPPDALNFTVAHELGHFFLDSDLIKEKDGRPVFVDLKNVLDIPGLIARLPELYADIPPEEKLERLESEGKANEFASSLLMPEKLARFCWEKVKKIEECAKIFCVPMDAAIMRLHNLGIDAM